MPATVSGGLAGWSPRLFLLLAVVAGVLAMHGAPGTGEMLSVSTSSASTTQVTMPAGVDPAAEQRIGVDTHSLPLVQGMHAAVVSSTSFHACCAQCGQVGCAAMLPGGGLQMAAPTASAAITSGHAAWLTAPRPSGGPVRWGRARPEVLRT